jgi:protein-S-isoprenylcysteine O-methyltransferase Ste14
MTGPVTPSSAASSLGGFLDSPGWQRFTRTKLYDVLAALPLIAWCVLSAAMRLPSLLDKIRNARPQDIDAGFVVSALANAAGIALIVFMLFFVLIREPAKAKSKNIRARIAAVMGTFLGVLVSWAPQAQLGLGASALSLALLLGGMGFAVYSLAHLGRAFSLMAEARHLVTDGPYSAIRHPLYLGEFLGMLGLMLQFFSPLAIAIVAVQFGFQLVRMKNEERILAATFPEYGDYARHTARLIPGLY